MREGGDYLTSVALAALDDDAARCKSQKLGNIDFAVLNFIPNQNFANAA